jgi:hypothetical protein
MYRSTDINIDCPTIDIRINLAHNRYPLSASTSSKNDLHADFYYRNFSVPRRTSGLIMSPFPKFSSPLCHFFDEKHEHLFALYPIL